MNIAYSTDEREADEGRQLAWIEEVEGLLGHSLDGNQKEQGYSLDYASDLYDKYYTPQAAALWFDTLKFRVGGEQRVRPTQASR